MNHNSIRIALVRMTISASCMLAGCGARCGDLPPFETVEMTLIPQNESNVGSQMRLLVENSDVVDSAGYGIAIDDSGSGYTDTVDLGGGELGSLGNNRIIGSVLGELNVRNTRATAKNNWWGEAEPRIEAQGEESVVDWQPALQEDPRPSAESQ